MPSTRDNAFPDLPQRWLFVPGDDAARLEAALTSGADAIVVDLEEFTPAAGRQIAIRRFGTFARRARSLAIWPAVRINPLDGADVRGRDELAALIECAMGDADACPAAVFIPAVERRAQLAALDQALAEEERQHGFTMGTLFSMATLESREGLLAADELLAPGLDTPRLLGALIGTGDLATDLGLSPDLPAITITDTLKPWRQRLAAACRAHQKLAIDGPWRWENGLDTDQRWANQHGLHARCVIYPEQIDALKHLMPFSGMERHSAALSSLMHNNESVLMTQNTSSSAPVYPVRNGGQILVDQIRLHGTKRVFLVPGESYLPCIDALNEHKGFIEPIVCRQESGAGYMAEAYGKLTNEPGVCFVTRGPGATNASIAVHTAYQDSTPMILFIGQVGGDFIEREAFQEIDYRRMFGEMSKWVAQIDDTSRIPEYVARAYQVARSGRPGPVVLALPEDTLWGEAQVADIKPHPRLMTYPGQPQLDELKRLLANAERPFLLIGGSGWTRDAQVALEGFAQRFDIPVGVAWRRLECVDAELPQFAGHVGMGMHPQLREQLVTSDLVIAVGTRIGEATSEGYSWIQSPVPVQKLVHIYPDPEELGRVYQPTLAINTDVNGFALALSSLSPDSAPRWSALTREARAAYLATLEEQPSPGALSLDKVSLTVDRVLDGKVCITVGAGNYALYAHRYVRFRGLGSSLAPTVGSMGYGLPAAISSKLEYPDRPAICYAGDGCFQMNMQELGVALQYRLGIVVLVFNNGMWGTIRAHQENDFPGREIALTFTNPDFASLVTAYGGFGQVVEKDEDFEQSFRCALEFADRERLPALIELRYDPDGIAPGKLLSGIRDEALARNASA